MKDWDNYRLILALEKAGTIRGAGLMLGVNHSTVSRRLSQLELNLKQTLFEKTPLGYTATECGKVLIENARQIQNIVFSSTRQLDALNTDLSGALSLSIPDALGQYLLLDALVAFTRRHPLIKLTVTSSYNLVNLDKNEADVVVRGSQNPPEHLVGHRLFPYYICGYSHKHYFRDTAFEDMHWITQPFHEHAPAWIKQTKFKDVPVGLQISDVTLRYLAMSQGKGLARATCYMADKNSDLRRLPEFVPEPVADLWVLTHPDKRQTPKVKALMKHLYDAIYAQKALITGQEYKD